MIIRGIAGQNIIKGLLHVTMLADDLVFVEGNIFQEVKAQGKSQQADNQ
jgi:hypothetical protein